MSRRRSRGGSAVLAVAAVAVAALLTTGGRAVAVPASAPTDTDCASHVGDFTYPGDLDGDDLGDTVVGVPSRNLLDITWASGSGRPRTTLSEAQTTLAGSVSAPAAGFGSAVVLSELNDDVCQDYAVGAPATGGTAAPSRGAVDLVLSGPTGPQTGTAVRLDGEHAGDRFGAAVEVSTGRHAAGATQVDLWVGAPGYTAGGVAQAGAVYHYTFVKGDTLQPQLAGIITEAAPVAGDHFGSVLDASYGLTNPAGTVTDSILMVGIPDRTVSGRAGAGEVMWIRRDRVNDTTRGLLVLNQNSPGVPGIAEAGDHFGASISAGDAGRVSLVGIPGEDIGSLRDAGMVQPVVIHNTGSRSIPATLSQDSPGVPGVAEAGDQFGASVLVGAWPTLPAIGSPGESVGSAAAAGMVQYLPVDGSAGRAVTLTQGSGGLGDRVEAGDRVGATLAAHLAGTDGGATAYLSPMIGVPGESGATAPAAGIVEFATDPDALLTFRRVGFSGGAVTSLRYGTVLAQLGST